MKYFYTFLALMALLLASGCKDTPQEPSDNWTVKHSDCKGTILDGSPEDCLRYEYDGKGNLKVYHVNAGFNCCPEHFQIPVVVSGNRINIDETVVDGDCDCNCLYDLTYSITGIKRGIYIIEVDEPLIGKSEDKLILVADLSKETGEYCITREHYPW